MNVPTQLPIVLFEDDRVVDLGPIVHTRPAFELRCGILDLRERVEAIASAGQVYASVRAELIDITRELLPVFDGGDVEVVAVNAQLTGSVDALARTIGSLESGSEIRVDGRLWMARLPANEIAARAAHRDDDASGAPPGLDFFARPWDVVAANDEHLVGDAAWLATRGAPARRIVGVEFEDSSPRARWSAAAAWIGAGELATAFPAATLIDPERILVAEGARVRPGAVIDAEAGPVVLGPGCVVHPTAVVVGPAYVGPGSVVNPGAKLREGTSVGAFCKVGGEIEESVVHDLSNKQHDGFLGHALVGSWVNLGADTNGSDLKNNYGPVRVDLGDGPVDTGLSFVGQHLADHVKTGIDTMLTTGGVVGVAGNVFGGGFAPRFFPAFGWGGADGIREYRLEDALRTARTVMARRDVRWTPAHDDLLRAVFARTAAQRAR